MTSSPELARYRQERSGVGKNATLDDLWSCYRLFLNRQPDDAGFESYAAVIRRCATVDELVRMFASSPEYANRVKSAPDQSIILTHVTGYDLYVPKIDAVVGEEILAHGTYEPHVTAAMRSVLREGQIVVDVGANIGYFTLLAAKAVGNTGQVIAFEPLARNVRLLLANILLNKVENVTLLPFGAGEREGMISLFAIGSIASSRAATLDDVTTINAIDLSYARPIDAVMPVDRRVDIIKIDIDGFDYLAMLGARKTLEQYHPEIFAEFGPGVLAQFSGIKPIDYLRYLHECGYRSFTALLRDGSKIEAKDDIERIARLPAELKQTHVDLHVRRG